MNDILNIIDDITNGGYVAPRLADMANAHHERLYDICCKAQVILDNKETFRVTVTETTNGGRKIILRDSSFLDNVPSPDRTMTFKFVCGKRSGDLHFREGAQYVDRVRIDMDMQTARDIAQLDEVAQLPVIRMQEFDMPYGCTQVSWPDELRYGVKQPVQIRLELFEGIRKVCGCTEYGLYGETFSYESPHRDNYQKRNEFASLFCSKKVTKSMESEEMAKLMEAPLSDLGLKNVDDFAIVIWLAGKMFGRGIYMDSRASLCDLKAYFKNKVIEAQQAGVKLVTEDSFTNNIADYPERFSKESLCRFIEFLGGTVPETICWRRVP